MRRSGEPVPRWRTGGRDADPDIVSDGLAFASEWQKIFFLCAT
jgi:hypothetical protein